MLETANIAARVEILGTMTTTPYRQDIREATSVDEE